MYSKHRPQVMSRCAEMSVTSDRNYYFLVVLVFPEIHEISKYSCSFKRALAFICGKKNCFRLLYFLGVAGFDAVFWVHKIAGLDLQNQI